MRGRIDYNPDNDPPPDLGLEIEVSRGVLNRLGIMAAFGVPEVWRFDRVLLLGPDGQYHEGKRGRAFPFLPVVELVRFVHLWATLSDTAIVRAFRAWVREQKGRHWPSAPHACSSWQRQHSPSGSRGRSRRTCRGSPTSTRITHRWAHS